MLSMPGPWFVSPHKATNLVSLLSHLNQTVRHPSQYPHVPYRGYTVASQVRDEVLAAQLTAFPDLVRLVDYLCDHVNDLDGPTVLGTARLAATRLREQLGSTGEWPAHARVQVKRGSPELPLFGPEHLEALRQVGLEDQARMFESWRETRDPFRGLTL